MSPMEFLIPIFPDIGKQIVSIVETLDIENCTKMAEMRSQLLGVVGGQKKYYPSIARLANIGR
jgi:hypothetical protein